MTAGPPRARCFPSRERLARLPEPAQVSAQRPRALHGSATGMARLDSGTFLVQSSPLMPLGALPLVATRGWNDSTGRLIILRATGQARGRFRVNDVDDAEIVASDLT